METDLLEMACETCDNPYAVVFQTLKHSATLSHERYHHTQDRNIFNEWCAKTIVNVTAHITSPTKMLEVIKELCFKNLLGAVSNTCTPEDNGAAGPQGMSHQKQIEALHADMMSMVPKLLENYIKQKVNLHEHF